MVTEQYVSFETAKLLKEKGFDESCYQKYDDEGYLSFNHGYINEEKPTEDFSALAPTQQMALRWLRENHKLHIEVEVYYCEDGQMWLAKIQRIGDGCTTLIKTCMCNDTYETAIENALVYCLNYFL